MTQDRFSRPPAQRIVAGDYEGQRIDNYLMREWRGAPKSLIYRLIRTGQVRVNSCRARPDQRLRGGDRLRLPPNSPTPSPRPPPAAPLVLPVLREDSCVLAVNKPAGLAAHGGSGQSHGVIERMRAALPESRFLELAHRLDKETSGALLLAKKRSALRRIQEQWRRREVRKRYEAIVFGEWREGHRRINSPLKRTLDAAGNRRSLAVADGKPASTETWPIKQWRRGALIGAAIATGRTHQLRVHLADAGLPIVGDDKYGLFADNRRAAKGRGGLARMFLHAAELSFAHPESGDPVRIQAPIPSAFARMGERLDDNDDWRE